MCMSLKYLFSVMSLKNRRFSLDSYALQDPSLAGKKSSGRGKKSRQSQSVDDARLEIQEMQNSLNSKESPSKPAITEENLENSDGLINNHSDGLINNHSFVKHNKTFHKLFQEIPDEENLTHAFTCALQKDLLYHGRLFVSENYVCFYSSVLLKDTKVVIPVSSVREVKKHLLSIVNIQTADGEKYSFRSLRNREMCYNLLQTLCSQAQGGSANSTPPLSAGENEVEQDVASSDYSLEDSLDPELQHDFPPVSRESLRSHCLSHQSSSTDEVDQASSWFWSSLERVSPFFSPTPMRNLSPFIYLTVVLLMMLLLASGYMGLRIIALEAQLKSLGALTDLVLHSREYQDT